MTALSMATGEPGLESADDLETRAEGSIPPAVIRLAGVIRRAREKKGWSQRYLAERARVSHEFVRRLESNECHPRLNDALQLLLLVIDDPREQTEALLRTAYGQIVAKRIGEENDPSNNR